MKHSTRRIINQILDLCLQKQIHFDINTEVFNVSIRKGSVHKNAYYYGYLHNNKIVKTENTLVLSELLEFVKKY